MTRRLCVVLILIGLALPAFGQESTIEKSHDKSDKVVTVGFGDSLPPFCIADRETGIEVEIFREALAFGGYVLKPVFLPIKRAALAFQAKQLDGSMMDSGIDLRDAGGLYGEPAVIYDNVFLALKERKLKISKPSDLAGLSVLAFPGALQRYPEWLELVNKAGKYFELNDQALQVRALENGRYDLVLSDRYIFRYFFLQQEKREGPLKSYDEHDFVRANPKDYQAIFRDPTVLKAYENGLARLKKTGRYKAIFDMFIR